MTRKQADASSRCGKAPSIINVIAATQITDTMPEPNLSRTGQQRRRAEQTDAVGRQQGGEKCGRQPRGDLCSLELNGCCLVVGLITRERSRLGGPCGRENDAFVTVQIPPSPA